MHTAIAAQKDEIDLLLVDIGENDPKMTGLKLLQDEITQQTNSTILGLQFQDLTSQLLSRKVHRIIGLRSILSALKEDGNVLPSNGQEDEFVFMLNQINKKFEIAKRRFKRDITKSYA